MNDEQKSKAELLGELREMRQRVAEFDESKQARTIANLNALINNRKDFLWSVDRNFDYIVCNDFFKVACLATYGEELNAGANALEILSDELKSFWLEKYSAVLRGEKLSFEHTEEVRGGLYYYEVSLNPIIVDKVIIGVSAIAIDVTVRKRAEKASKEANAKYKALFEGISDAVFVHPLQDEGFKHFIEVNQTACERLGYSRDELLRLSPREVSAPKDAQLRGSGDGRRKLLRDRWMIFEAVHLRKDGTEIPVEISSRIFDYEGCSVIMSVARDISERKEAEEALRQEQSKAQMYLDMAGVMFIALNANGEITLMNRKGCEILECAKEDIVGKSWFDTFLPIKIRGEVSAVFKRLMVGEIELVEHYENPVLTKGGEERIIAWHNTILKDGKGNTIGILSAGNDITERVQAKRSLEKYASQLETLNTITAALSTSLELDKVLELILDQIGKVIPFDSGAIFLYEDGNLRVMVDHGFIPSLKGHVFPSESELFREVQQTGKTLILVNAKEDVRFQNWGQSEDIVSWMGIPLILRDTLIGFLTLDSFQPNAFSAEQAKLALSFASQAAQAIENARQYRTAETRAARLDALRKIDQAITGSFDIKVTMSILLENLLEKLQVDAAVVLLYEKSLQSLRFCQGAGFRTNALMHTKLSLGRGQAGKVALERRSLFIPDLNRTKTPFSKLPEFKKEGFHAYQSVPLIAKGELVGVLEVFHRSPLNPNNEWMNFLNVLAGQAAIAIDNAALFNNLQYSNARLLQAYHATIEGWAKALELKDLETEGHSRRIVEMTTSLARNFNIRGDELLNIQRGALLHDIGKMGVPDRILQKKGALTEEEWEIMRLHPVYAYEWLLKIEYLRPALDIPHYHHERWDGTGYPLGLKEEQIPLSARIFAIVDVWDALRSNRSYRKAWSREKTLKHIRAESGKHFDPQVVTAFLDYIEEKDEFLKD